MIEVFGADSRGATRLEWLESRHTFSFGDYYDPANMGFGALRVLNDDRVQPGAGFGAHRHADMEILTCVLEGALAHQDSTGTAFVVRPGDVQRMSAGTGVVHSEMNPSPTTPCHFLQIWILPRARGLPPSYEQKTFPEAERRERLVLVASPDGRAGSLIVHQDVSVWTGLLAEGQRRALPLSPGRRAWVQLAKGAVYVNGVAAKQGDGVALTGERQVQLAGAAPGSEVLVFDLI